MKKSVRKLLLGLISSTIFALSFPSMGGVPVHGTYKIEAIWSQDEEIFLCFNNPEPWLIEKDGESEPGPEITWVQNAIYRTWLSSIPLAVSWETKCPQNSPFTFVRIQISDEAPHTNELGKFVAGQKIGLVLNFTFQNWSKVCASSEEARQYCIETVAVHEFGHVLGFAHENNRNDPPQEYNCPSDYYLGIQGFGPWDLDSVMNYCNPEWNNNGLLSKGDITLAQYFYGTQVPDAYPNLPPAAPKPEVFENIIFNPETGNYENHSQDSNQSLTDSNSTASDLNSTPTSQDPNNTTPKPSSRQSAGCQLRVN